VSRGPIAVVGCGFPQLGLLRAARALDLEVVGLDLNPRAVGVPLASRFVEASTGDPDAIAAAVRGAGCTALTTTGSELALTTAAAVAARLGLPFYADPETVRRCQEKDAMRAGYAAAGLPTPRFAFCTTEAEARRFVDEVGLPVVVKPARGWGQRGVALVNEAAELGPRLEAAAAISRGARGAVVEECLRGPEVSVNGWVERGELVTYCVTDREVFPGLAPLGVMRSEIAPPALPPAAVEAAARAAADAARALGLLRGPCYSQVCLTERGPVLFETAARCGGGFDADVTRLFSGVDLYARLLGVALGDPVLEAQGAVSPRHPAALVRFLAPPRGLVRAVGGLEAARSSPGVVDADVYVRPGDRLEGLVNAASRMAHLLVVGDSRAEALARAAAAEALWRVETTPEGLACEGLPGACTGAADVASALRRARLLPDAQRARHELEAQG
jgi:S-sulfo-L-cysteine synthase (3-phospho-L-serine-dependent)